MKGVRAKIVVAALKAQGLVLEEEQEEEPEEVESVTVCYWCIFDESAGRRIGRRSAVTLCREAPAAV